MIKKRVPGSAYQAPKAALSFQKGRKLKDLEGPEVVAEVVLSVAGPCSTQSLKNHASAEC